MNPLPSGDPDRTAAREPSHDPAATVDASADATRPRLPPPPAGAPAIPGYAITGEIARGGMGMVYAARDLTLDREVAIKTLLPGADAGRFVTESKITAKLPHPNIPPVHALGTLANGTPFLAMKLIRGRTLADQLKTRPTPQHDLPRLVQVFEQVAQAVGFAHSRGVIHRDLKPGNVMVGEFGEVQVMDWGLARFVAPLSPGGRGAGGEGDGGTDHPDLTRAGAVMGTPGYMAPEQARAEPLGPRADVFALGAVLAAILTGKPAFVGTTARETIQKAANADLSDVLGRLDGCGADAELIALAKRCLSAEPNDRPADGRAVAAEVEAYRGGVDARLRRAETERAEAVVRGGEQRKRRRVIRVATGTVLSLVGVAAGVMWWASAARAARAADATRLAEVALARADQLAEYARTFGYSSVPEAEAGVAAWQQALAAGEQAEVAITGESDPPVRARVAEQVATLREGVMEAEARLAAAERGARFLDALAFSRFGVRKERGDALVPLTPGFDRAFRLLGIDVPAALASEPFDCHPLAAQLRALPPGEVRTQAVLALYEWADQDRPGEPIEGRPNDRAADPQAGRVRGRLLLLLNDVDPDPWRVKFRSAINPQPSPGSLQPLLFEALKSDHPAADYILLSRAYMDVAFRGGGRTMVLYFQMQLLERALQLYPNDPMVNEELADVYDHSYYRVDATAMDKAGSELRRAKCLACYQAALALRPRSVRLRAQIGRWYRDSTPGEGVKWIMASLRQLPDEPELYDALADCHLAANNRPAAIAAMKKACELDPSGPREARYANALRGETKPGDVPAPQEKK